MFFRILQHLLPDGVAWRTTVQKRLRTLLEALAEEPAAVRVFVDKVYRDLFPESTRELAAWERFFVLPGNGDDATRRQRLAAAWQETGGQAPRYLQDIVQAAGFDLYVHEWWSSGPPWVARDPRAHTQVPLIGTVQCGEPDALCGEVSAQCNAFLANEPGYLVNIDLTPTAPPRVPDDPDAWPYFVYFGGATFGDRVPITVARRRELEDLLLKLCPAQHWIVLMVDWVGEATTRVTLAGDTRTTLSGDTRFTLGL